MLTIRIEEIAFVTGQNKRKNRTFVRAQVSEAAAIGVPDSIKGEALVCFCVLKKDANGDTVLAAELKESVARDLGKALAHPIFRSLTQSFPCQRGGGR